MKLKKSLFNVNFFRIILGKTIEDIEDNLYTVLNEKKYRDIEQSLYEVNEKIVSFMSDEIDSINKDEEIKEEYSNAKNYTFSEYLEELKE